MPDPEISATGVFFDTKNQKVVDSAPEEGVQILAPGGEVTPDVQADIDRWREVESGAPAPVAEAVTTETAVPKSSKRA
jgi:hypothetical protein